MNEGAPDEPQHRSWLQRGLELVTIIGVAVSGLISADHWTAVGAGAVALLFLSDRGQHRALIEAAGELSPTFVAALSVGAHLMNNLLFCALAFCAGRLSALVWFDAVDGRHGAWGDVALWSAVTLGVVVVMKALWWMLERAGR